MAIKALSTCRHQRHHRSSRHRMNKTSLPVIFVFGVMSTIIYVGLNVMMVRQHIVTTTEYSSTVSWTDSWRIVSLKGPLLEYQGDMNHSNIGVESHPSLSSRNSTPPIVESPFSSETIGSMTSPPINEYHKRKIQSTNVAPTTVNEGLSALKKNSSTTNTKIVTTYGTKNHGSSISIGTTTSRRINTNVARLPSVDFFSCCGLGHRMTRLADAYNVAKQFNFTLRVNFGFCDYQDVFSYFFCLSFSSSLSKSSALSLSTSSRFWTDQELIDMTAGLRSPSMQDMYLKIGNDVGQFKKLIREGPYDTQQVLSNDPVQSNSDSQSTTTAAITLDMDTNTTNTVNSTMNNTTVTNNNNSTCPCFESRFQSDLEIYSKLRDRFRNRKTIDEFRMENFHNRTVIGLHLRLGNGEQGQFERKNRTINGDVLDRWINSMSQQLLSIKSEIIVGGIPPAPDVILFVATDTLSIINKLREKLTDQLPIISLNQTRIGHGRGVLFGERGRVTVDGEQCLHGWEAMISDMMLLSYVDVLIAGRPSSFTQSLPMTMVLSTSIPERKVRRSFCEVNLEATDRICYETLMDWCCRGKTSFSLEGIQRYDYRRFSTVEHLDPALYLDNKLQMRPSNADAGGCWPTPKQSSDCLPIEMPDSSRLMKFDERILQKTYFTYE